MSLSHPRHAPLTPAPRPFQVCVCDLKGAYRVRAGEEENETVVDEQLFRGFECASSRDGLAPSNGHKGGKKRTLPGESFI